MKNKYKVYLIAATNFLLSQVAFGQSEEPVEELDSFIAEEEGMESSLLPTNLTVGSVFGGNRSLMDTPRSVSYISAQELADLNIRSVLDFKKTTAGSFTTSQFGGPSTPGIRGQTGEMFQNGVMRTSRGNGTGVDFNSVGSIEFIKGPPSVIYGASNRVGGYVNLVTKKPYFDKMRGETSITLGEYDTFRWLFDVGGPINEKTAYRVSIGGEDSGSFYRFVTKDSIDIYAALTYLPSDLWTLEFSLEFFDSDHVETSGMNRPTQELIDSGMYFTGSGVRGFRSVVEVTGSTKIDRSFGVIAPDDFAQGSQKIFQFNATYKPVDNWTLINRFYAELGDEEQREYAQRYYDYMDYSRNFYDRIEIIKDFDNDAKTQLIFGGDLRVVSARNFSDLFNEYINPLDLTADPSTYEITNDMLFGVVEIPGKPGEFAAPGGSYPDAGGGFPFSLSSTTDYEHVKAGLFAQIDTHLTDELSLITGARLDGFWLEGEDPLPPPTTDLPAHSDSLKSDAYALNAALNWKASDKASLYSAFSYSQSYQGVTGGGFAQLSSGGKYFATNLRSDNYLYEVGSKFSLLDDKVFGSVAAYHQERTSTSPVGAVEKVEIEGFEFEMKYQPSKNFQMTAAYTYIDSTDVGVSSGSITRSVYDSFAPPFGTGAGSINFSPIPLGDYRTPALPKQMLSTYARYQLGNGFGGLLSATYTSSTPTTRLADVVIPSQYNVDAALFYNAERYSIRLDLYNITDEENWTPIFGFFGSELILPDQPFRAEGSVSYRF